MERGRRADREDDECLQVDRGGPGRGRHRRGGMAGADAVTPVRIARPRPVPAVLSAIRMGRHGPGGHGGTLMPQRHEWPGGAGAQEQEGQDQEAAVPQRGKHSGD